MNTTGKPYDHEIAAVEDILRTLNKHVENLSPAQLLGVIESVKLVLSRSAFVEFKKHEH